MSWLSTKSTVQRVIGREAARELGQAVSHLRGAGNAWKGRGRVQPVSPAAVQRGLREVGVAAGDTVLLHSAIGTLSRAGTEADSEFKAPRYAADIINAILDLIGSGGTLAVPTAPFMSGIDMSVSGAAFDADDCPTGTGLIPNLVLARPERARSSVPWQNLTAIGARAQDIVADHAQACPYAMGPGSPWHRLMDIGAKVLLLGVDHDRSSTVHILEHTHPAEYPRPVFFDKPHDFRVKQEDGAVSTVRAFLHAVRWEDPQINNFCRYVDREHNIYRKTEIGKATLQCFDVRRQYDAFFHEMQRDVCMYDWQFRPGA